MEIISARYAISSPSLELCPAPDRPEYALIGRSNVGKSSLINMLTGRDKLARTSNSPGKTQFINHFKITSRRDTDSTTDDWYLVDLPGFGFAKRSKSTRNQWEDMTEKYIRERKNLIQLFLLIDGRHQPQKIDLEFVKRLYRWEVPYTIVFTKSDKESQRDVSKNVKAFSNALSEFQQFLPRMIITSAIKGSGRNKILALIDEMNQEWQQ